jgi:hypothetical protein
MALVVSTTSKVSSGFDPRTIPGCALWLDAADRNTITLSGSAVTQWNDKSGNGYNLTPIPGLSNAAIQSNYQNNLNVLNFTGSNIYRGPSGSGVYPSDAYLVVSLKSLSRSDVVSIGATSVGNFNSLTFGEYTGSRWHNGSDNFNRTPNTVSSTDETSTGFLLMNWSLANNNFVIRRNGTQISSTASYTFTLTSGSVFQIGARHGDRTTTDVPLNAYMAEVLVFDSQLNTSMRQQIEGYLSRKWGLSSNLPATHLYRSIPIVTRGFQPIDIPDCVLWLDAADSSTLTLSGSNVTAWRDKSPSNVTLTLSNHASGGGTTTRTTFSNLPVVQFSNSCFYNSSFSYPLATRSIFFIISEIVHQDFRGFLNFANSTQSDYNEVNAYTITSTNVINSNIEFSQNGYGGGGFNTRYNSGTGTTLAPFRLYEDVTSGTSVNLYDIGTSFYSTTTSVSPQTSTGFTLMGRGLGPSLGTAIAAEVLLFNRAVTTSERRQIEGYLAAKWGLRTNLPSTHPFKLVPAITPTFSVAQLPALPVFWIDAARETAASGSFVNTIPDRGLNGVGITPLVNNTVTVSRSYLNGTAVYNLGANRLITTNITWRSKFTMILVSQSDGSSVLTSMQPGNDYIVYVNHGNWFLFMLQNSMANLIDAAFAYNSGQLANTTAWSITIWQYDLGSSPPPYRLNGTARATALYNGYLPANDTTVTFPLYINGNRGGSGASCRIAEMMLFNDTFSLAQLQQIEGYLASKWGLQSVLPTTHPYKKITP